MYQKNIWNKKYVVQEASFVQQAPLLVAESAANAQQAPLLLVIMQTRVFAQQENVQQAPLLVAESANKCSTSTPACCRECKQGCLHNNSRCKQGCLHNKISQGEINEKYIQKCL